MRRIGLLISVAYGSGGMFQYSQQILKALISLPKDQFKIIVFHTDEAWSSIVPEGIERQKIEYPRLVDGFLKILFRLALPNFILSFLFSLTKLSRISKSNFDLVIFPSQDLAGLFLTKRSVNVVHDIMHRYEPQFKESSGFGRGKFRDRLFRSFCKYSRLVLVDSALGKIQLKESYNVDNGNIEILPYIAPEHIVSYKDDVHAEYFTEKNLPSKFIFYPAQFWPHKNHQILLEAAILLKEEIKDFRLIFLGPKNRLYNELYKYSEKNGLLNIVDFLGYVPNEVLGGFYSRARAMIMPTFFGPTNIPPLEAIALKCPVAVSNIYGMPDQLSDAAIYFNNRNSKAVAEVLRRLWNDDELCDTLKNNAEKHFAKWNGQSFGKRLHEIINSL